MCVYVCECNCLLEEGVSILLVASVYICFSIHFLSDFDVLVGAQVFGSGVFWPVAKWEEVLLCPCASRAVCLLLYVGKYLSIWVHLCICLPLSVWCICLFVCIWRALFLHDNVSVLLHMRVSL